MKRMIVALLVVGVGLVSSLSTAFACGNAMRLEMDRASQLLTEAASMIERGDYRQAIFLLRQDYHHLRSMDPSDIENMSRFEQIALIKLSVSVLRSGGHHAIKGRALDVNSKKARSNNVSWAVSMIQGLHKTLPETPEMRLHIAEAQVVQPKLRHAAYLSLKDLADDDLMAEAYGYALLAELAAEFGDAGVAKAARKSCEKLSVDGSKVCHTKPKI